MVTIVIFALSVIVASLLIVLRLLAMRSSRESLPLRFMSKYDSATQDFVDNLRFRILQVIQTIKYLTLVHMPSVADSTIAKYKLKMLDKLETQRNLLMGRKNIQNRGSVSFFLKKIDETKKQTPKGFINDTL
ncbi:MAG: hypothetical protein AAB392_01555 [Patescibacteria group bacterium]